MDGCGLLQFRRLKVRRDNYCMLRSLVDAMKRHKLAMRIGSRLSSMKSLVFPFLLLWASSFG
eukprot:5662211-Amphidinium_carterae.1